MEHKELQLETGSYTRVVNKVLDELCKAPLLGSELAVCLFVIRKTYGYHKKNDSISLTQFEKATGRSRMTIVKALKNLQLVNILILVKKGSVKNDCNIWTFNKYYRTWKLVKTPVLVKDRTKPSIEKLKNLVYTPIHTKEITKEITKETLVASKDAPMVVALIDSFEPVNKAYKKWYARPPQRDAASRLIAQHGLEQLQRVIKLLPISNQTPYFPTITTPLELEDRWSKLESAWKRKRNEQLTGKNGLA